MVELEIVTVEFVLKIPPPVSQEALPTKRHPDMMMSSQATFDIPPPGSLIVAFSTKVQLIILTPPRALRIPPAFPPIFRMNTQSFTTGYPYQFIRNGYYIQDKDSKCGFPIFNRITPLRGKK